MSKEKIENKDQTKDIKSKTKKSTYSKKKKTKKNITNGIAYVQSTFNNTIVSIADTEGNVIAQRIHQFGTATQDQNSVHYDDQARLFAKHKMKPVWMKLEDIKLNLEKAYQPGQE